MKLDKNPATMADSENISEVLLSDGVWYPIVVGSFKILSPSRQSSNAFLRFQMARGTSDQPLEPMWVDAPLKSMVAVLYPNNGKDEVSS